VNGRHRAGTLALILVGGTVGTLARAVLEDAAPAAPHGVPWMTVEINVTGSFLLGLLLEVLTRTGLDTGWRRAARLTLGTGVLGGFTTYSTFAVEVSQRLGPAPLTGAAYAVASVVFGVVAAALGYLAGHRLGRWQGLVRGE
jgi:CrcB protein